MKNVDWDLLDLYESAPSAKSRVPRTVSSVSRTGAWHVVLRSKITFRDRRLFFSTLAKLLRGGIAIHKALGLLESEMGKPEMKEMLVAFRTHIAEGTSLSSCLRSYPALFPRYQASLVEAGEASGQMDKVLEDIARQLEKEEETKAKLWEAVSYPAFLVVFGLVTVFVLTAFIIPKLAGMYEEYGEKLPWMTLLIIQISQGMKFIVPLFLFLGAVSFLVLKKYGNQFYSGVFRIPIFGSLFKHALLIRLSYLLSLLLGSGIPLLGALEAVAESFGDSFLRNDAKKAAEKVRQGKSLAESLRGLPFVSETALALILSGEESGTLPESLGEISKVYAHELESATRMILKLLEPALILAIGTVTGLIVVAMILPILSLSTVVR